MFPSIGHCRMREGKVEKILQGNGERNGRASNERKVNMIRSETTRFLPFFNASAYVVSTENER